MAIAKRASVSEWAVSTDGENWTAIYVPAPNTKIEHTNVASSDSGRTEDGQMHINWVRRDVRKVNLIYSAISGAEKALMESLMQGQEFYFRYVDPHYEGETLVKVDQFYGYTGESNYQEYSDVHYASEGGIFTNFSINVVEK